MKRHEIEAGKVYAYRERSYGPYEAALVIATDTLYRTPSGGYATDRSPQPKFRRTDDTRPSTGAGSRYSGSTGFAVLLAGWNTEGDPSDALKPFATGDPKALLTLREALESETCNTTVRHPLPKGVKFAVINNRFLVGEYDTVMQEIADARQARARYEAEQDEKKGRKREQAAETAAALAAHGVTVEARGTDDLYGQTRYQLTQEQADRLIELLGQVPVDPVTDERRDC